MTDTKLDATLVEVKRFLLAAEKLRAACLPGKYSHPVEQGAVRRSSLDLTRALADLRRP